MSSTELLARLDALPAPLQELVFVLLDSGRDFRQRVAQAGHAATIEAKWNDDEWSLRVIPQVQKRKRAQIQEALRGATTAHALE